MDVFSTDESISIHIDENDDQIYFKLRKRTVNDELNSNGCSREDQDIEMNSTLGIITMLIQIQR